MSTNRLRYFVRLDGKMNIVPGSLIARRKGQGHPRRTSQQGITGDWMEIFSPNCCTVGGISIESTPTGTPSSTTNVTVVATCNSKQIFSYTHKSPSFNDTVDLLTDAFPGVAIWSTNGSQIIATNPICTTLTFTVAYA